MEQYLSNTGSELLRALLDGWDMSLEILLIVMSLDYITGLVSAFKNKRVSSSAGYAGLLKKATIFIIVILAAQLDRVIGNSNHIFRNCTALSFTINDGLSILENAGQIGMKLPSFLSSAFIKLQQQNDGHANSQLNQYEGKSTDVPPQPDQNQPAEKDRKVK